MLGCNNWCLFGLELVQTRIPPSVGEGLQSKPKPRWELHFGAMAKVWQIALSCSRITYHFACTSPYPPYNTIFLETLA